MNWDDLRFVLAALRQGTLLGAARELGVEHTTVGRRIEAAEKSLGTKLFARGNAGLVLTVEGQRLLEPLRRVEDAFDTFTRRVSAEREELQGTLRVTSPETFGITWLAPRLAAFARQAPGLIVDLQPSGQILDLSRREAEVAIRFFRSSQRGLTIRRVGDLAHGLYASHAYLSRFPLRNLRELKGHACLTTADRSPEALWFAKLAEGAPPIFTSPVTLALLNATKAGEGIAVLPRYLGDMEADLQHIPAPDEPREAVWLTAHRELRTTPRVRAVMDFLAAQFERERMALLGR